MKKPMLIFLAITLAFILICLAAILISHYLSQPFPPRSEMIIGEIVAVYHDYIAYVKPVGDQATKHLLEFRFDENISFASGDVGESYAQMPELIVGAIVEINYTFTPYGRDYNSGQMTIDTIKTVGVTPDSGEWPKLNLNEDFDWDKSSFYKIIRGEVVYTVNLDTPIEGYIVYVYHEREARWGKFFVEANNKFISNELRELLNNKATGYTVELHTLESSPFEHSSILGAFIIELIEE